MARILLAEDDVGVRRLLARVLARAGYDVTATEDGAAALEAMKDGGFDALVTDIEMPHMTGIELVERRTETGFDGAIVVMSGGMPDRLRTQLEQLIESGVVQEFVVKPTTPDNITRAVRSALDIMADRRRRGEIVSSGDH